MPVRIKTGALSGIAGLAVSAEVMISRGLPGFHLVGLPGAEVRESRERVLAALRCCGIRVPPGRITVNLAPAGVRKCGASFDLAIAVGIVAAVEGLDSDRATCARLRSLFIGELSLFGELRPVRGLLPVVLDVARRHPGTVVVPAAQAAEAALAPGLKVVAASCLKDVIHWCRTGESPDPAHVGGATPENARFATDPDGERACLQLSRLEGQELVRKTAVVAAVGRHNLLLVGPPGTGKTRLARILARLQAPLAAADALAVTRIQSAAGTLGAASLAKRRPCRAPHHTVTRAGLLGGGPGLRPGELTLAHGGMLFLDELAEFQPAVLDVLRQPLEEGLVTVDRGAGHRVFPARFQLVAATNPCRCGYHGSQVRACRCPPHERVRYMGRLSGPLLDRIDLFVEVGEWRGSFPLPESQVAPEREIPAGNWRNRPTLTAIAEARRRLDRWRSRGQPQCAAGGAEFLDTARVQLGLSLRAVHRCLRVATTIAALDQDREITVAHLSEALEFRRELLPDRAS